MRRQQDPKIKLTVYVSRTVAGQLDIACTRAARVGTVALHRAAPE